MLIQQSVHLPYIFLRVCCMPDSGRKLGFTTMNSLKKSPTLFRIYLVVE